MNRMQALFMPVATEGGERYSVALPLLLAMFTLVLWFGFQSWQLVAERNNLKVLAANQATMYANAQKMRAQLDSIASGVAELAREGNANAAQAVQALAGKGITIKSNGAAGESPSVN